MLPGPYANNTSNMPNNLSVSQFLADTDYAAELTDLTSRLDKGQENVYTNVNNP